MGNLLLLLASVTLFPAVVKALVEILNYIEKRAGEPDFRERAR